VLYTSSDQEYAEPIVAAFTKKTGIQVRCRFDVEATKTVGLVQRLRSEAESGRVGADVFWSNEIFETIRLAKDGLLAPYRSAVTADWPSCLRDPEGRWYGFALRARVLAYHTGRLPAAEVPRSIEDLLDPKWRGRIVMARPEFGTTRGHVAAMWVHYGPQETRRILEGLKRNGVQLVSGNSTAVRVVAEGRADVCLTDTDDVWVAQRNGWPIDLVYPHHGKAGTLVIPNTVALVRGGPNAEAAGELMDYLLSAEVEEALARSDSHNVPIRAAVAAKFPDYALPEPMDVDYAKAAEAVAEAVPAALRILSGG